MLYLHDLSFVVFSKKRKISVDPVVVESVVSAVMLKKFTILILIQLLQEGNLNEFM